MKKKVGDILRYHSGPFFQGAKIKTVMQTRERQLEHRIIVSCFCSPP